MRGYPLAAAALATAAALTTAVVVMRSDTGVEAANTEAAATRSGPPVQFLDSAGVSIRITPPERVAAAAWTVVPEPIAVFDGSEGGLEPFHLIASMAFTSDTTVVLGEMAMVSLRHYTLSGGFLRVQGRGGQGPGEFGALNRIASYHDSLVVYDSRWNRVSVFGPDGSFARLFTLEPAGGQARFEGLLPNGRILGLAAPPGSDRVWGLWDLAGDRVGPLEELPGLPPLTLSSLAPGSGHRSVDALRPLRPYPYVAVAGGSIVAIPGGGYRFDRYDEDGRMIASERLNIPARRVTRAVREDWAADVLATAGDVSPSFLRAVEEADFPQTLPSFGTGRPFGPTAVLADDRRRIWVAEYPATAPQRWFVFADGGGLVGLLRLPDGFELEAVRGDVLLGVQRDELDVQRAVVLGYREGDSP